MVNLRGFLTFAAFGACAFPQTVIAPANGSGTGSAWALAWETLDHGLQSGDPEHRKEAIASLGAIGNIPEVRKRIEKALLEDKDVEVRQTAAGTLAEMQARESIPTLQVALDDNPEVSFAAAKALWELGDESGRWEIQQVLAGERKDAPGFVEGIKRDAKKKLHKPSDLALMGLREGSGTVLGPGSIGVKLGLQAMKDGASPGRVAAAEILAKDKDPYALTLLEWALTDKDEKSSSVRAAVAQALGERGNEQTIAKLVPSLTDDRNLVRMMSAASIVKLRLKYP